MVMINGVGHDNAGETLAQYLSSSIYDPGRIAVECNGEIVPKDRYGQMTLQDGDTLEIVSFVGGG